MNPAQAASLCQTPAAAHGIAALGAMHLCTVVCPNLGLLLL